MKYLENEKVKYSSLSAKAQQLRKIVETKYSKSLDGVQLDELESLWEQNNSNNGDYENGQTNSAAHSTQQDPVNMHLFYGNKLNGSDKRFEQNEQSVVGNQHYEDFVSKGTSNANLDNCVRGNELQ